MNPEAQLEQLPTRYTYITYIATSPERVWQAMFDSELLKKVWGNIALADHVGGPFTISSGDGSVAVSGEVLVYDPYAKLSYTFDASWSEEPASHVTFTLEEQGDKTKLSLVHDQFPAGSDVITGVCTGWPLILAGLKSQLEGVDAENDTAWAAMKEETPAIDADGASMLIDTWRHTVHRTYIAAPIEKVWRALTESEFTQQYFAGQSVASSWKVGDPIELRLPDGTLNLSGVIRESDAPNRLAFTMVVESIPGLKDLPESVATFDLQSQGAHTMLTLTESHAAPIAEEMLEGGRQGWAAFLSSMKSLLETGRAIGEFDLRPPVMEDAGMATL